MLALSWSAEEMDHSACISRMASVVQLHYNALAFLLRLRLKLLPKLFVLSAAARWGGFFLRREMTVNSAHCSRRVRWKSWTCQIWSGRRKIGVLIRTRSWLALCHGEHDAAATGCWGARSPETSRRITAHVQRPRLPTRTVSHTNHAVLEKQSAAKYPYMTMNQTSGFAASM